MKNEKVLNVKISLENHNFVNELQGSMNESPDVLGRMSQADIVDMLLTRARIKFKEEKEKE